jgi:TetR/AcrR family transcriptional repressor of nem operon
MQATFNASASIIGLSDTQPKKVDRPRRGRPSKQSINVDTKELLIRSGLEHLTEYGFTASGIDAVLKRAGVPKGSFYYYFSSKEAFGKELIASYDTFFANKLDIHLLDERYPPLERLQRYVLDAQKTMKKFNFKRGCLIGNLGQEVDSLPESYRNILVDVFLGWQQRVEVCLSLAQERGQISTNADCSQLAEYFWIGWEGAVSRAKLTKSLEPLKCFFTHFMLGLSFQNKSYGD